MSQGCTWYTNDPLYTDYHDIEWGVPEYNSRSLWEKLVLDGFQAGLSWITILKKREAFRLAFDNFDPYRVAQYTQKDILRLLENSAIVRHRAKIESTIKSARLYQEIESDIGFNTYIWNFVDGVPIQNNFTHIDQIPAFTDLSIQISKDLKQRGFSFCGPTIVYAFMQAMGMVNDHVVSCPQHLKVQRY